MAKFLSSRNATPYALLESPSAAEITAAWGSRYTSDDGQRALLMTRAKIHIGKDRIAEFCRQHHVRKLALFGSVLRDDFRPDSDIDVLVEFEPGHVPGLAFFTLEKQLSGLLGRDVDLHTSQFLSPYFREQVLAEAEVQYAAS